MNSYGNMPDVLPDEILAGFAEHTGAVASVAQPPQGCNSSVWRLQAARGAFIVKRSTAPGSNSILEREADVLQSLVSFPQVPRFVARTGDCFLFTGLDGVNLATAFAEAVDTEKRTALSAEYGRLLRTIHGWKPPVPQPADWLSRILTIAEENVREVGPDTPVSSPSIWQGDPHHAVWEEIQQAKDNVTSTIVFCHGDWCLPNALITDGRATGAVDWGDGGWADFRTDLAMGLWSLRYNSTTLCGDPHTERYLTAFLRGYGYNELAATLRFWEALRLLT